MIDDDDIMSNKNAVKVIMCNNNIINEECMISNRLNDIMICNGHELRDLCSNHLKALKTMSCKSLLKCKVALFCFDQTQLCIMSRQR